MSTTPIVRLLLLAGMLTFIHCGDGKSPTKHAARDPYILKETIAQGADTLMTRLAGIKQVNEWGPLCQHWEVAKTEGATSRELLRDPDGNEFTPGIDLFADSTYLLNPRGPMTTGTWRVVKAGNTRTLILTDRTGWQLPWQINELSSQALRLQITNESGKTVYFNLAADGQVHQNKRNDPFHPINNWWRIPPTAPESDSAIKARAKGIVKFYALFYRDNILRKKDKINFAGLPDIFDWYSRGIGMPDWEDIRDSYVDCFYNKEQAEKGYQVLRRLIIDHEFKWPKGAPDWRMETHSVLEQMYHKMK
ncbi:hypothetical protein [Paraflavitalea pollutisoli]|uniref:hypothetical protein n=1 Tax=Paraflavitalea pollutisoli TaxID=3034143 RepID=UPI0023EDFD65|nr:hypothetical protein [Paraflavitalea sp. H1-2-19X]